MQELLLFCKRIPAIEKRGPCVVESEVLVDTHYSTDIINHVSLTRGSAEVSGGKKNLSFCPEGEGNDTEGHQSGSSPPPSCHSIHPHVPVSSLYLRCFISLSWWLFPPPSPLSSILIASIR